MSITLGGISLPEQLVFVDEFSHDPVAQYRERNLGGGLDIEETQLLSGQPITLQGGPNTAFTPRTLAQQIKTLAATPNQQHTLTLNDGSTHQVVFRRGGQPAVEATPIYPFSDPEDDDPYWLVIRLLKVD